MAEPFPLEVPPGVVRTDSKLAAKNRYGDSDKIRFKKGKPEKWEGWTLLLDDQLVGIARGARSWTNQYGNRNVAFGTHKKLFALTGNDTLTDITPVRASGTLANNPFATTNGSAVVTVTHTSHGLGDYDYITLDGSAAVGGITPDGEYQVIVVDANSYTITHSAAATSTVAAGGGASVTYAYQISIGSEDSTVGLGYGSGDYGEGTFGTERSAGLTLQLRHWSLEEYGNDLLASPFNGKLYLWEEATDAAAELVTNSPTMRAMVKTPENYILALGSTTPMTVSWPDIDDITDWTPSATNTANERKLASGSRLVAGVALTDGATLVWSDTSLYVFRYTGSQFIYDSPLAGTNCGLAAPLAYAEVSGVAYWMSGQSFHMYSGGVQKIPNVLDIEQDIFRNLNRSSIDKCWAIYDQKHNQVRFHYPRGSSDECSHYVDVNLDDWAWSHGTLDRTTGTLFRPTEGSVLMVDESGSIYQHNDGSDANGAAMEAYLEFPMFQIGNGRSNMDISMLIPDFERQTGDITIHIWTKDRPRDEDYADEETLTCADDETEIESRVAGRHVGLKITSNTIGGDFRVGTITLELDPSGDR